MSENSRASGLPALTERQRAAVDAEAGVAIVAGAGTGKTHTLGLRYLAHLADGTSPLAIVAVTFTERAAHELRARVRRQARARLASHDPRLDELEAAPIGTVHALCLRICRDHPEAAGVPPDVGILDPLEGSIWTAERLGRALERVPARLFDVMPYERVRDVLAELLRDPYRAERALAVEPEAWPAVLAEARRAARRAIDANPDLAEARATLAALRGPDGDAGERTRRAVLAAFEAADRDDPVAAAAAVHNLRSNVGSARIWGASQERLRSALATALPLVRSWAQDPLARLELGPIDTLLGEILVDLRAAFEQVRASLDAAKRRAGVVDFADLETSALRALGDDTVRDHYRRRWRVLLVDEVQDTSPIQEAILAQLAAFCRTTLVGDPKQSIYGFRGADADVFRRMTEAVIAGGGGEVVLDRSFRTHAPLVERMNDVFAHVLGDAHEPLEAHHATAPNEGPHLHAWRIDLPKGVPSSLVRLAEAHRVADEILTAIDDGVRVRDPDAEGGTRPLRPGDVAILARTWAPLDLLAEILPARGLPAVHTGGGDLLASREAQDGIAAVRVLADRHDDVALVALLRGPAFAIADDDLDRLAEAVPARDDEGRRVSWWTRLEKAQAAWADRPRRRLEELLRAARHEPPSRLLQRLDRMTGWSAVVANLPGGPRRRADLEGFVAFVRDLERDGGDVNGVVRRLRRLIDAGVEVPRPPLEAEDAVTLTTVHRSKGLEWPFVVVAAIDVDGRSDRAPVLFRSTLGVALRLDTPHERRAEPALWTVLHAADRAADDEERRRLLYVALTRGSDHVALSAGRARGSSYAWIEAALESAGIEPEVREVRPETIAWPEPPVPDAEPALTVTDGIQGGPGDEALSATDGRSAVRDEDHDGAVPRERDGATAQQTAWELVLARVGPVVPEAAPVLARLREAGAAAPTATFRSGAAGFQRPWILACWDERDGIEPRLTLYEGAAPSVAGRDDTGHESDAVARDRDRRIGFDLDRVEGVEGELRRALGLPSA